jgi:hypothetical protein
MRFYFGVLLVIIFMCYAFYFLHTVESGQGRNKRGRKREDGHLRHDLRKRG